MSNIQIYQSFSITCAIALILSLFVSVAYAQSEDDLYLKAFGKKKNPALNY